MLKQIISTLIQYKIQHQVRSFGFEATMPTGATGSCISIPVVGPLTLGVQIGLYAGYAYDAYKASKKGANL